MGVPRADPRRGMVRRHVSVRRLGVIGSPPSPRADGGRVVAKRAVLLHPNGIVVNVFMAADENPAVDSGKPDHEGRLTVAHETALVGDRILKGTVFPRVKVAEEIAAEEAKADPVVGGK